MNNSDLNFGALSDEQFESMLDNGGELPEQTKPEIGKPLVRTDAKGNKHITSVKGDKADYTNFNETGSQYEDLDMDNPLHAELAALRQANKGTLAEQHVNGTLYGKVDAVKHDPFAGNNSPLHMQVKVALEHLDDGEKEQLLEAVNHGSTSRMYSADELVDLVKSQHASKRVEDIVRYSIDYAKQKNKK